MAEAKQIKSRERVTDHGEVFTAERKPILFLGPTCPSIETYLSEEGHSFVRTEEVLSPTWIKEQNFCFGLSYRYKKIISQDIIDYFEGKLINMHISFLPWNKGADPNLWSYIENTPKGVTIHRIDVGIDTGDILLQQKVPIDLTTDTLRTSYDKLSLAIETLFINNAKALLTNTIPAVAQAGQGSFHYIKDKLPYLYLYDRLGFDTPLSEILTKLGKLDVKTAENNNRNRPAQHRLRAMTFALVSTSRLV